MFELGRELKRLLTTDGPKDGLTGGDASLLELLDLSMLRAEARCADIAAGRVSAKDPAQRRLEAAAVWREIARRTGDPAALRKAAAAAEAAAKSFGAHVRPKDWARARCEQAEAALLAADLFGDEGLRAAASHALAEARKTAGSGATATRAAYGQARITAEEIGAGGRDAILTTAETLEQMAGEFDAQGRRRPAARLTAAEARMVRAGLLADAGARLRDGMLSRMAIDGFTRALGGLDAAYEPLSWARAAAARGAARATLAALDGDVTAIAEAVDDFLEVLERLSQDHSPLDWARIQLGLATVLQMLGEATESERAFDQALRCYERAQPVLDAQTALSERGEAAYRAAVCLARRAELFGDLAALRMAESALRAELAAFNPGPDPVGWAVRQLNFARLYEARAAIAGPIRRERAAAIEALSAALEVFGEHGHRTLADTAARGLARLGGAATAAMTFSRGTKEGPAG